MDRAPQVQVPDRQPLSKDRARSLIGAAQQGDKVARDELVEANLKLVLSVVKRFAGRGVDMDDLFQVGCVGLIRAVERFDLRYDVAFSTYAVPRIIGEIRRHLRDDHPVKVSRGLKTLGDQATAVRERLTQSLGRSPTPTEIAKHLGTSREDIVMALDAVAPPTSLDQPLPTRDGRPVYLKDQVQFEEEGIQPVECLALAQVLASLSDSEREFVKARFLKGLSQARLAQLLGCSQAHISRMERRVLGQMRRLWHS